MKVGEYGTATTDGQGDDQRATTKVQVISIRGTLRAYQITLRGGGKGKKTLVSSHYVAVM